MTLPGDVVLAAVAYAADAVVIVDGAGTICYWNDGAARIFGYRTEELLGSTLDAIISDRLQQRHNGRSVQRSFVALVDTAQRISLPCPRSTLTDGSSRSSSASSCSKQMTHRPATSLQSCATPRNVGLGNSGCGGGSRRSRECDRRTDMTTSLGETMRAAAWGSEQPVLRGREICARIVSFCDVVISWTTASRLADAARLINALPGVSELRLPVAEVLSLEATAEGHARLEAQTATGHLLFRP